MFLLCNNKTVIAYKTYHAVFVMYFYPERNGPTAGYFPKSNIGFEKKAIFRVTSEGNFITITKMYLI